jgi:hypothetical protein
MNARSFQRLCLLLPLIAVCLCLVGHGAAVARADLVTFQFEAKLVQSQGSWYPFVIGQRVSGNYTFDMTTPPTTTSGQNTFTWYSHAITNFTVTIDGYGTGTANDGNISLGDPVQTTGSYNFLSDMYVASSSTTGITIPSIIGDRHLLAAEIDLQDLDQQALDSENLLATPPDLALFLDHAGSAFNTDHAWLMLTFDVPWGGGNSATFQMTSLTAVPEPGTASMALTLVATLGFLGHRRIGRGKKQNGRAY